MARPRWPITDPTDNGLQGGSDGQVHDEAGGRGGLAGGAALAAGCHSDGSNHSGHGDPCWPDRYSNESRAALCSSSPRWRTGRSWTRRSGTCTSSWHRQAERDGDGQAGPDRPPVALPDPRVFIQTARDIGYDPAVGGVRGQAAGTGHKRTAVVQKYLAATLTGRNVVRRAGPRPGHAGPGGAAPRIILPTPQQRVAGPVTVPAGQISPRPAAGPLGGTTVGPAPADSDVDVTTEVDPSTMRLTRFRSGWRPAAFWPPA